MVPVDESEEQGTSTSVVPKELFANSGMGATVIPSEPGRRLMWAREILVQALGEVRVGFGRGGGLVGVELAGLVEGVGRELGVMRSVGGGGR